MEVQLVGREKKVQFATGMFTLLEPFNFVHFQGSKVFGQNATITTVL